ncbi:MAG: hypothetical protein JXR12_05730 [Neptunomonas phycophila]|uniref:hypothetical protein n=1 Tax=Neptunomonas phycophila TaxID=1572645 RepID=UPI003B8DB6B5
MDLAICGVGVILTFWFGISFLGGWAGDSRDELMQNQNGSLVFHICAIFAGILIFLSPMAFYSNVKPLVMFETEDTIFGDQPQILDQGVFLEVNGDKLPMTLQIATPTPACEVTIKREYPFMTLRNAIAEVTIVGKRCSEVPTILGDPQVKAVLSGWRITVDEIKIPTNMEY